MSPEVRQALKRGRARVAKSWSQAVPGGVNRGRGDCVVTSLGSIPSDVFSDALGELGFSGVGDAARWNDASGRSKEQVLVRFDEALA